MNSRRALIAVLALTGALADCKNEVLETPPAGDATVWPPSPPQDPSDDPELRAIAARLPTDWSGTGVLERREAIPRGAPQWVRIVAEISVEDGKRFLRASGIAPRIHNPALGRTASDNRARAELLRWIGSQRLTGSEILDHWGIPGLAFCARARVAIPADWQPGHRLPPGPEASNEPTPVTE